MRGRSPRGSTRMRGPDGLVASYRSLFTGEGRAIVLQGTVAFLGGLCEALVLVVLAKLAFSIGGETNELSGLGPLESYELSVAGYFRLAVVLALARAGFQALAAHLTASVVARSVTRIREGTFLDYARASWEIQSSYEEAAIQDLLTRHVARATGVVVSISLAFYMFFTMAALLVSAVVIDPVSSVLVVGSGTVLFGILRPLSALAKRYSRLQLEAGRKFAASSLEAISLSLEIRAFGVNDEVARRLAEDTAAEVKPIYVGQFLQRTVLAVYQLFAVTILLVGLWSVYAFLDRPLASLGAIVIILVRSLNMASNLQGVYHAVVETAPFADELNEQRAHFRDSVPPSGDELVPAGASLVFDDVSYRYSEAAEPALDHVSFTIRHGEAVGVIGPSGSGKSTLIQLVLRLRQPSEGRYLVGGVDARDLEEQAWFERVAFVPQDCQTVSDDVMENIRFFRPWITDDDVVEAAKRAHVHEEILAMPEGYQTDLGSRGGGLSGGQRQRVAIARALAGKPQLLVLDEPTSALDMRSESLVHDTLTDLQGSVTMLIIAHRLSTLKTCDRIIVMGAGGLQAFGERSELEENNAFYREAIALSKLRS